MGSSRVLVAHTCNPSYLGGQDLDHSSRLAWVKKKFMRPHLNRKKLGVVMCICHLSYSGKNKIGGWPGKK
jgi:hypothetical protein